MCWQLRSLQSLKYAQFSDSAPLPLPLNLNMTVLHLFFQNQGFRSLSVVAASAAASAAVAVQEGTKEIQAKVQELCFLPCNPSFAFLLVV